jgi:hypothetical protein
MDQFAVVYSKWPNNSQTFTYIPRPTNIYRSGIFGVKKYHLANLAGVENPVFVTICFSFSSSFSHTGLPDGFFFKPKIPIWENFGGPLMGKC